MSDNALITGSTGFIGKRLVNFLLANNFNLRTLSRNLDIGFDCVVCNLEKDKIPESCMESIDTVIHLAGFAHDTQNPIITEKNYYILNVDATVQLAELAVMAEVKRFVPGMTTALATMVTVPLATVPAKLVVTPTLAAAFVVKLPRLDVSALVVTNTLALPTKPKLPIDILATLLFGVTSAFASIAEISPKAIVA